jgi:hypothetical protein
MDKKCYFCKKPAKYTIGVAVGFSGWDYNFCEKCQSKKTIKELVDKILEEYNG